MKILAFAASNSRQSINKALVTYATTVFHAQVMNEAAIEMLDLNDYEMPIYSIDRENETGIPELATEFYQKIGEADALIIAYAEHNGTYSAAYKNIFDWMSRIDRNLFQNKPMVLLGTSPGGGGAKGVMAVAKSAAPHFAGEVKAELSVPSFYDNFDTEKGELKDTVLKQALLTALASLEVISS